jgi:biotin carboxyl carrier protein
MYKAKVNEQFEVLISQGINKILPQQEAINTIKLHEQLYEVQVGDIWYKAYIKEVDIDANTVKVIINGNTYTTTVQEPAQQLVEKLGIKVKASSKHNKLTSPMPGLILNILVSPGQQVNKGDNLIVLEAMKMENVFKAPQNTTIKSIAVQQGESVDKGQDLILFESE